MITTIQRRLGLLKYFELYGIKISLEHLSKTLVYYITKRRYEEEERKLCERYFTSNDKVIEFGSSIGFLSLYCKRKINVQKILCVEPNPDALKELRRNYDLNDEKLEVLSVCLANSDEEITFHSNVDLWKSSFVGQHENINTQTITVRGARIKTVLAEAGFEPTAIIMDIEGGESSVDFSDLCESVKKIVMELHPGLIGVPRTYKVLNDLMNIGFQVQQKIGNSYALTRP